MPRSREELSQTLHSLGATALDLTNPRKEPMQIQLKQTEIVCALKQYIAKQGIDLAGKTIDISFTAGRKDSGLSADISIEDTGVTTVIEAEEAKPVLAVVKTVSEPLAATPAVEAKEPETAAPAGKSLFG